MAKFFTPAEPRPCIVTLKGGEIRPAFCHLFSTVAYVIEPSILKGGHPGGQISEPCAVVEYKDGTVCTVPPSAVHFLDTVHQMSQYVWPGLKGKFIAEADRTCENCKHFEKSCHTNPCALCEDVNGIPDQWEARE